jgi:hypothetical protein
MRPSGIAGFPVTKQGTKRLKKIRSLGYHDAINSSNSTLHSLLLIAENVTRQALNFFSEETAVLSGKMRSLDFLPLFGQAKSGRKIKERRFFFHCHYHILRCVSGAFGLGMTAT